MFAAGSLTLKRIDAGNVKQKPYKADSTPWLQVTTGKINVSNGAGGGAWDKLLLTFKWVIEMTANESKECC